MSDRAKFVRWRQDLEIYNSEPMVFSIIVGVSFDDALTFKRKLLSKDSKVKIASKTLMIAFQSIPSSALFIADPSNLGYFSEIDRRISTSPTPSAFHQPSPRIHLHLGGWGVLHHERASSTANSTHCLPKSKIICFCCEPHNRLSWI